MKRPNLYDKTRNLQAKYGITLQGLYKLQQNQGRECGICKKKRKLQVDHDHKTGVLRGLLCNKCNVLLGFADDNPFIFILAVNYLQPWTIERRLRGIPLVKPNKNAIPVEGPRKWSEPRK